MNNSVTMLFKEEYLMFEEISVTYDIRNSATMKKSWRLKQLDWYDYEDQEQSSDGLRRLKTTEEVKYTRLLMKWNQAQKFKWSLC